MIFFLTRSNLLLEKYNQKQELSGTKIVVAMQSSIVKMEKKI